MKSILELHKTFLAALLMAFIALAVLPACSTTEEEPVEDTGPTKDEICDEADAGTTDCPK